MSKIKVVVLGYGHLGKWHCQKVDVLEQAELVAIVEPYEKNQVAAKQNHSHAKIVSDVKEIIDEFDAAIIVTPTSTHFELTQYLLENKKHVFCEKPLCSTSEEVQKLKPYLSNDLILQVGHSERCHKVWSEISNDLNDISSTFSLNLNRVAAFKGRATDVDVVQDLMIHDLDLLIYLLKYRMPVRLKAYGHKIRTDKWDHVTCLLEYKDGSHATITSGRNHVKEIRDLVLMHDKGCLEVDLFRNTYSTATSETYEDGSYVKNFEYEKRDHLLIEHDNFYNAILGKESPMVNFDDGQRVVYLLDKVIESLNKEQFVELSL